MPSNEVTLIEVMKNCKPPPQRTPRMLTNASTRITTTVIIFCGQGPTPAAVSGETSLNTS